MAELLTCRRSTGQVGGDTACQHKWLAHGSIKGPTHKADAMLPTAGAGTALGRGRTLLDDLPFAEVWAIDFEFGSEPGANPEPVCLAELFERLLAFDVQVNLSGGARH